MPFLNRRGSLKTGAKVPSTANSTTSSGGRSEPLPPAGVQPPKGHSNLASRLAKVSSSSPSQGRKFNTLPLPGKSRMQKELCKVVLRDFPGYSGDQLLSLRNPPPECRCSSCACVAGVLQRAECGCAFCAACLRNIGPNSVILCRAHNIKIPRPQLQEDPYAYALCMELDAMCIWSVDGCNFEGSLISIHDHSENCIFRETNCVDCDKMVSFRAMKTHKTTTCAQRRVHCDLCGAQVLASALERHIGVCPQVEVMCILCGRRDIKRGDLDVHKVECTSVIRPCRMEVFGCEHQATNVELKDHESLDAHWELIVEHCRRQDEKIANLEHQNHHVQKKIHSVTLMRETSAVSEEDPGETISDLKNDFYKQLEGLRSQVLQLSNKLKMISCALIEDPFYWNLCPYKGILEIDTDGAQVLYSDSFYTPSVPGYKMRLRLLVDHRAKLLHLTPQVLPGQFNNIVPWPFPANYLLRLVDQSGNGLHKDLPVTTGVSGNLDKPTECGRVLRSPNLQIKFDELHASRDTRAAMYSKNDCIVFMFKLYSNLGGIDAQ